MSANSRRPTGVTVVAVALFCFFFSAIGNLVVWRSAQSSGAYPPGSPAAGIVVALTGPPFVSLVSLYAVTALIAATAAWRMLRWMSSAFVAWSIAALLLGAFFLRVFLRVVPAKITLAGRLGATASLIGMMVILWLVYRYLRRMAIRATNVV